jgi:hypothetical protein
MMLLVLLLMLRRAVVAAVLVKRRPAAAAFATERFPMLAAGGLHNVWTALRLSLRGKHSTSPLQM